MALDIPSYLLGRNAGGGGSSIPIATEITSSSTNTEAAGAKAVYDAIQDNYSTTEQVVGTWIDGKPLYETTITQDYTMTNNAYSYDKSLSDLNLNIATLAQIVWINKKIFSSTNYDFESNFYYSNTEFSRVFYRVSNTSDNETLRFRCAGANPSGTFYVTLRYTKTTD